MKHVVLNELDQEVLIDQMIYQLDELDWKQVGQKGDATVYWTNETDCPYDGFRTVTEHQVPAIDMVRYLGKGICTAMSEMNHMYTDGGTIKEIYDKGEEDYYAVVKTCFKMPFPMQNREFLHSLYVKRRDENTAFIIYHSIFDEDLPPVKNGYLRCPTYLSGQRITTLENGNTRVEHMMVYGLAGRISPGIQNKIFKAGHVKAYLKEWQKLVDIFRVK